MQRSPSRYRISVMSMCVTYCYSNSDGGEVVLSDHQLQVRQKQLDYGKNTPGYQRYITLIPK